MTKRKKRIKQTVDLPVIYLDKNNRMQTAMATVEAEWDEEYQDWLLDGKALNKLDEVKARHMFDECKNCPSCQIRICLLNDEHKEKRWGKKALERIKDPDWLEDVLHQIREQCFHMSDEEAGSIVDEFIEEYPDLLKYKTREWLIKNS